MFRCADSNASPRQNKQIRGSGEQYFLGSFDGKSFRTLTEPGAHGWTNYGKDDYCAISYNDMPKGDKPVLIGWMNNWQYASKLPTSPWRGQMSVPRQLSFVKDSGGIALKQEPVIAPLRGKSLRLAELLSKMRKQVQDPLRRRLSWI